MLASTSYSVAQIASEVGYESEAAFNRAFKREFESSSCAFPQPVEVDSCDRSGEEIPVE